MKDTNDYCKSCFNGLQEDELERQEYSQNDSSEESDTPDGIYEEQAAKVKVPCSTSGCTKFYVYSRESRYLESHGSPEYGCDICSEGYTCSRGYFRCPDHFSDQCKQCFAETQETF